MTCSPVRGRLVTADARFFRICNGQAVEPGFRGRLGCPWRSGPEHHVRLNRLVTAVA